MEAWVALAIAVILAFPIVSIIALVMTLNARDGVRQLEMRVAMLEASRPPTAAVEEPQRPVPRSGACRARQRTQPGY